MLTASDTYISAVVLISSAILTTAEVIMNREGCGTTKACLFKPPGCDPNLDCTIGLIIFPMEPNQLRVEMVATSLIPTVQQQYIAIAFSKDSRMGEDFVTECVMSNMGQFAGWEPEVFISFNHGNSNDRIFLDDVEHGEMISNVSSEVVDGRLVCHFTQQIFPRIDRRGGLIWSLDKPFYIMGATGSAQPDEVNAHDMNRGSHFYPVVSSARINPSQIGEVKFDLPLNTNLVTQDPLITATSTAIFGSTEPFASAGSSSSTYRSKSSSSSAKFFASVLNVFIVLVFRLMYPPSLQ